MKALLKIDENKNKTHFSQTIILYRYFTIAFHLPAEAEVCRSADSVVHFLSLLSTSIMKTHTIGFLVAVLVFAALFSESDYFGGPFGRKKLRQSFSGVVFFLNTKPMKPGDTCVGWF